MIKIEDLLKVANANKASDLHITVGLPPLVRMSGSLVRINMERLMPEDTKELVDQLVETERVRKELEKSGEVDFSFARPGIGRYRVNVFKQRGTYSAAMRAIATVIPSMENLGMPVKTLQELADNARGLILVTGPTGSGKSTTLASMIDYINDTKKYHILTLEDPIEYLHKHKNSMVNQREVGADTTDYGKALRAALREDPDVILVGEMRDLETISTAVTAAETGHLVLSTLHTVGAAQTIDRIIDVFPTYQQAQIRVQLANILKGVVSQQLIPRQDQSGRCVALEIMVCNVAIANLIREGKSYQINSQIQIGGKQGMMGMDKSLVDLYKKGMISMESVINYAQSTGEIQRLLNSL